MTKQEPKQDTIEQRESDPKHIAVCLNDLARQLGLMAKTLENAKWDAKRIALMLAQDSKPKAK